MVRALVVGVGGLLVGCAAPGSVSANGARVGTGIVWASRPLTGNANQQTRPGAFYAFDAETLTPLWDNQRNVDRDGCGTFAKFSCPTVSNGKVHLASFSKKVCVYGLMP